MREQLGENMQGVYITLAQSKVFLFCEKMY